MTKRKTIRNQLTESFKKRKHVLMDCGKFGYLIQLNEDTRTLCKNLFPRDEFLTGLAFCQRGKVSKEIVVLRVSVCQSEH